MLGSNFLTTWICVLDWENLWKVPELSGVWHSLKVDLLSQTFSVYLWQTLKLRISEVEYKYFKYLFKYLSILNSESFKIIWLLAELELLWIKDYTCYSNLTRNILISTSDTLIHNHKTQCHLLIFPVSQNQIR